MLNSLESNTQPLPMQNAAMDIVPDRFASMSQPELRISSDSPAGRSNEVRPFAGNAEKTLSGSLAVTRPIEWPKPGPDPFPGPHLTPALI